MRVHIIDSTHFLDLHKRRMLKSQVRLVLKNLSLPNNVEICITFVDDNIIRNLNETYRGIKRATDVLSFPQDGPDETLRFNTAIAKAMNQTIHLGDIVISVDTAKRHARLYGNSLKKEIQKLIIHGILHILGYDHKKKNEAFVMRKKEKELLSLT